jgi:DNA-binding response OmpR family regulator
MEFDLLYFLAANAEFVINHEATFYEVWVTNTGMSNSVDVCARRVWKSKNLYTLCREQLCQILD